ncbi:MAG: UDP-N-acetylmuramate dehydrogenase [Clostridiaceae bacterium]|nr:UDP-N-acetylmuramate dehydrogenase [Clostridiaceae bacterium]
MNRQQLLILLQQDGFGYLSEKIRFDEDMSKHCSMRVGGRAQAYLEPENAGEIQFMVALCRSQCWPVYVMGNGSNLVISDEGLSGLILRLGTNFGCRSEAVVSEDGLRLTQSVPAGALLSSTAMDYARTGWAGMAFAAGIPGTVGGAVYMNAGAYGWEMKDILLSVTALDERGEIVVYPKDELELDYRSSRFSKECGIVGTRGVILSATFELQKGDPDEIISDIMQMNAKRSACQPLNLPSAGSAFKRPRGHYAGALIEKAGLRGLSVGGAQVSEKHCGFIVNYNSATAYDVYTLVQQVQKAVYADSGVILEPEICFLGEGFEDCNISAHQ